ncbi:MAG TPA: hypothetical protein VGM92_09935 [Candidatus Kapabacteria bacterium]
MRNCAITIDIRNSIQNWNGYFPLDSIHLSARLPNALRDSALRASKGAIP